jgi:CDP-paratose 2-epimerase
MREGGNIADGGHKKKLGPRTRQAEISSQLLLGNAAEKTIGLVEWFRPGEYDRVERVLADCRVLGVKTLRSSVSWADWHTRTGQAWYSWLLPRLAAEIDLLPCFLYTPPSLGVEPKTAAPPRHPQAKADLLYQKMKLLGAYF